MASTEQKFVTLTLETAKALFELLGDADQEGRLGECKDHDDGKGGCTVCSIGENLQYAIHQAEGL